jgi:hypothetical protein
MSTQDFILKANKVHKERYSYANTVYLGVGKRLKITCKIHGDFEQFASSHLAGYGCQECGKNRKTTDEFISQALKIHKKKYSYEKTEYKTRHEKVVITCPAHGDFSQVAREHLRGRGCRLCSEQPSMTTKEFVKNAKRMHGKHYSYHNSKYINSHTQVEVSCPEHGAFQVIPKLHIAGKGCPACAQGYFGDTLGQVYVLVSNAKGIGKIGITGSGSDRIGKHCEQGFDLLVKLYQFQNGIKCIELEKLLKSKFSLRHASRDDIQDGHTETFSLEYLEDIVKFCDSFISINSGAIVAVNRPTSEYLSIWQKRNSSSFYLESAVIEKKKKWWQIF